MPLLPYVNDNEENVLNIVKKAKEVGVNFIYPAFGVTLSDNQKIIYLESLEKAFPKENLKNKMLREYENTYFYPSKNIKSLYNTFVDQCRQFGILYKMEDIIKAYKKKRENEQLSLF